MYAWRRYPGFVVLVVALLVLLGRATEVAPGALRTIAAAPATGTAVFNETFTGTSVTDPTVVGLNSGVSSAGGPCLTGATSSPPAGQSNLGPCSSSNQQSGPVPPRGTTPGYLQLTDSGTSRDGAVLFNSPLPATAGVQFTFEQYQYGGKEYQGTTADGIGFFLVNGSANLTAP